MPGHSVIALVACVLVEKRSLERKEGRRVCEAVSGSMEDALVVDGRGWLSRSVTADVRLEAGVSLRKTMRLNILEVSGWDQYVQYRFGLGQVVGLL